LQKGQNSDIINNEIKTNPMELLEIKNKNLRNFLKEYSWFKDLPDNEKGQYVEKMAAQSEEEQEETYNFLATEYEKEKLAILTEFYEKMVELEKKLTKIKRLEEENVQNESDDAEINKLLGEIETV
jgi:hypothetical protein